jgi:c-di-GMP-binding flagellar brake protein YcgR
MWDGTDRRMFVRAKYPCLITVRTDTPPRQAILTHTEDISVGGVRVVIRARMESGIKVDLEIDLMDTLPTIISKGAISWSAQIPPKRKKGHLHYDTGIQFIGLQGAQRQRIQNIINHILGKAS